jgi:hypothetical protein
MHELRYRLDQVQATSRLLEPRVRVLQERPSVIRPHTPDMSLPNAQLLSPFRHTATGAHVRTRMPQ